MKVEVVYKLKITETVDITEYEKENITLEEIQEWESGNLETLLGDSVLGRGLIWGKVEVRFLDDQS